MMHEQWSMTSCRLGYFFGTAERVLKKPLSLLRYHLGVPPVTKSAVFLNIVQTAVDPPPPRFEHCGADFF